MAVARPGAVRGMKSGRPIVSSMVWMLAGFLIGVLAFGAWKILSSGNQLENDAALDAEAARQGRGQ